MTGVKDKRLKGRRSPLSLGGPNSLLNLCEGLLRGGTGPLLCQVAEAERTNAVPQAEDTELCSFNSVFLESSASFHRGD